MLAPRPPPKPEAGFSARKPSVHSSAAETPSLEGLDAALAGDDIDWDTVYRLAGETATTYPGAPPDTADTVAIVYRNADTGAETDLQTLATFYDQDDARELLETLQTDIPEHYREYWTRPIEREVAGLAAKEYTEVVREARRVEDEERQIKEDMARTAQSQRDAAEFETLSQAIKRLKSDVTFIDTALSHTTTDIATLEHTRQNESAAQKRANCSRFHHKLTEGIAIAREEERVEQVRIECDHAFDVLMLDEFKARGAVDSLATHELLALSWHSANSKELARFTEEETEVRDYIERRFHDSLSTHTPALAELGVRAERIRKIQELKRQLNK